MGYFSKAQVNFWWKIVAQKVVTLWATFVLSKFFLHFYLNKHGLLKVFQDFKSGMLNMFWTFKLNIDVDILTFLAC